jgi:hypothetical protein
VAARATNPQPPQKADSSNSGVAPGLRIVTQKLKDGKVGVQYTTQLEASVGTGDLTWSKTDRLLPNGLALAANGLISGIPTEAKTSSFTIKLVDKSSNQAPSQQFTITINA